MKEFALMCPQCQAIVGGGNDTEEVYAGIKASIRKGPRSNIAHEGIGRFNEQPVRIQI